MRTKQTFGFRILVYLARLQEAEAMFGDISIVTHGADVSEFFHHSLLHQMNQSWQTQPVGQLQQIHAA